MSPSCTAAGRVGRSPDRWEFHGVPSSPQLLQGQDRHVEDLLLCIERRTESVVSIRLGVSSLQMLNLVGFVMQIDAV